MSKVTPWAAGVTDRERERESARAHVRAATREHASRRARAPLLPPPPPQAPVGGGTAEGKSLSSALSNANLRDAGLGVMNGSTSRDPPPRFAGWACAIRRACRTNGRAEERRQD